MRSSDVNAGDTGTIGQYNKLRDDAYASSMLLAHEQSTPDLTVYVEPGAVYFGETCVDFAGGNSPSFTAPATNPRIDVLSINSSGTLVRTAGTEAGSPVAPSVPSGEMPICQIYNKVGQTQIFDTDQGAAKGYILKDTRQFIFRPKPDIQTFTATGAGTWTKPIHGTIARIQVWGAGGAGARGASSARYGGGGGGGAYVEKWVLLSALGTTESISVGAGGPSQTTGSTAGASGGNTTFGSGGTLITAYGGGGGQMTAVNAGYGGGGGGGVQSAGATGTSTAGANGGNPRGWYAAVITATSQAGTGGAINTNGSNGDIAGGGGGGGGGGNTATGNIRDGGSATYGGGGGGGGADTTTANAGGKGGSSIWGGAGGGGGGQNAGACGVGGTSIHGGNGGAANFSTNPGTAGSQPGGGGGASENANSGKGGDGMVIVTVF